MHSRLTVGAIRAALWRHSVLLPAAVVLAGLCAAIAGGLWLQGNAHDDAAAAFQRKLTRAAEEVSMHFRLPLYGLKGARSIYATHGSVSRDIFRSYVRSRDMALEFPGVRGFGYIERVPRSGLLAFLERTRLDDAPGFALRQLGDSSQPEHFVVKFIEPAELNAGAAGVDLASEAVRRQGLVEALATGEPTVTGVIALVQDQRQSPGMMLYLPLYEDSASIGEPSARLLRGVLFAPIVISELLDGLSDVHSGQLRVALFDTASGTTHGPKMFDSAAADSTSVQAARRPKFEATTIVTLPGRLVTLRASSTAAFDAQAQTLAPWLFFAGTLGASLMLAGLLRQQASGRQRAEQMAQGMTADLSRLALVARRSSNAVVITDLQRRITWVNAGFERITGYSTAEALGQSPGQLLQGKATDPAAVLRMRQALDARQGFNGEILNRRKDGKVYWMSLDIQPLHDDAGTLVGFMAIQLDITERKQAERELLRERQSLQNVIEGTHVGTWEWNVETGETVYNERWAQIAGYTLAELGPPGPETWKRLVHPDDLQRSVAVMERHFAGLSEAYECEVRMLHKHGHWVWVLARGKLFSRTADGKPRWMAGTHKDISERKQTEAALQASQSLTVAVVVTVR